MTRNQAIDILNQEKKHCEVHLNDGGKSDEYYKEMNELVEAYDMAIKELESKDVLDKIRAEIRDWYWQADKQALAKDPCVVDAMINLFIMTINKYAAEQQEENEVFVHDKREPVADILKNEIAKVSYELNRIVNELHTLNRKM